MPENLFRWPKDLFHHGEQKHIETRMYSWHYTFDFVKKLYITRFQNLLIFDMFGLLNIKKRIMILAADGHCDFDYKWRPIYEQLQNKFL